MVTVPDERVAALSNIYSSKKTIYTTIEFCDIAGLVKGASRGEGLGNKFLGHIREVDAVVHVKGVKDEFFEIHSLDAFDLIAKEARKYEDLFRIVEKIQRGSSEEQGLFIKGFYPDGRTRLYAINFSE